MLTFIPPRKPLGPYDFVHLYEISRPEKPEQHVRPFHCLTTSRGRLREGGVVAIVRKAFERTKNMPFDRHGLDHARAVPTKIDDFQITHSTYEPPIYVRWAGIRTVRELAYMTQEYLIEQHDF
ncbi:MAG: hypothetical protein Q7R96_05815 [Nanoarchaeota archaeon]|nr:hypothetical protein [Nanoarchaeota archaeon]